MNRSVHLLLLVLVCAVARSQATEPQHDSFLADELLSSTLGQQPVDPSTQQPAAPASQQPSVYPPQNPATGLADQSPDALTGPVPLAEEPHHRLMLQNDFVRVYNVMVPPLDATQLHQHDLPYLYLVLGPADLINAVQGKPEAHLVYQDGDTRYSPGHFAHVVRTDSGLPFRNVTIELLHPQQAAQNLCKEVLPGAPEQCSRESAATKKLSREAGDDVVPYFETDEVRVDGVQVSWGKDYLNDSPQHDALLIGTTGANLDANLDGQHIQFLHGGDILWMPAGVRRRIVDFLGTNSRFLLISFKDSGPRTAPQ